MAADNIVSFFFSVLGVLRKPVLVLLMPWILTAVLLGSYILASLDNLQG